MLSVQRSSFCKAPGHRLLLSANALAALVAVGLTFASPTAVADYRSDISYTKLQQDLGGSIPTGANVVVSQVEASSSITSQIFMPDIDEAGFLGKTITNATDSSTAVSSHATSIGLDFYGLSASIAPDITNISVFSANDWIGSGSLQTVNGTGGARPQISTSRIANHSWVGSVGSADTYALRRMDWLVERDEFIQVTGLYNLFYGAMSSTTDLMGNAYNVIAVGRSDGLHDLGSWPVTALTGDTGSPYTTVRTRPDIVVPAETTSTATARISAAAALLVQTGHGNSGLSTDPVSASMTNRSGAVTGLVRNAERSDVIKAALMAGADRVTHNSAPNPTNLELYRGTVGNQATNGLDRRYGAGQLNVRNSYWIIAGGEQQSVEDGNTAANVTSRGFDYDPSFGGLNHPINTSWTGNTTGTYPLPIQAERQLLTASLVWNLDIRGSEAPASGKDWNNNFYPTAYLWNLNLTLVDLANGNAVVATSASTIENTENLWFVVPANAQYALKVTRVGSFNWHYGLAWQLLQDTDADGAYDGQDNCINVPNGPLNTDTGGNSQLDADGDGYGNYCDGDLNNTGLVTATDSVALRNALNTTNPVADLNGTGLVTAADDTVLRNLLNRAPGPSGVVPAP